MASRKEDLRVKEKDIPEEIVNPKNNKRYIRGRFLGKGGFAKCYELTDAETKEVVAGKIVAKALLTKPHQKEKMAQEISIHKSLCHPGVVGFKGYFEDNNNVYILLELCRRRSMMELHKRRKAVSEPEARYYMRQVTEACVYLHATKVIHRDLKLGNLFIDDNMHIKIGDFGLATQLEYDGERKKTLCGTPNYIAPEVLGKKGHSYEVDVWSLGCILYTLLIGKPPFETSCLKDTYTRIKRNEYTIPYPVTQEARSLIHRLLRGDPTKRPSMEEILRDNFFSCGFLPKCLPTSCLTMAPRFETLSKYEAGRKPLLELNGTDGTSTRQATAKKDQPDGAAGQPEDEPTDFYLGDLFTLVNTVVNSNPQDKPAIGYDEAEDPAAIPIYWVGKWVDYSDKYGLGYQLCDNSVGVLFNDSTRLILMSNGENIQYIERDGAEHFHSLKKYPDTLGKKVTLLKYFRNYMSEHLLKAGANMTPREGDDMIRLPFLRTWFRTRSAIILHLSNGTLQINFFGDHTKIILCPVMGAVTFINEKRVFRTFRLSSIEKHGTFADLTSRLRYARTMVERLLTSKSGSGRVKSTS